MNYRKTSKDRFDCVEVSLVEESNHPAKLLAFFGLTRTHPMEQDGQEGGVEEGKEGEEEDGVPECHMFALVHYFNIDTESHSDLKVPRCSMQDPNNYASYHIVTVESIVGHAHMVQDFDDLSMRHFWWDRISLEKQIASTTRTSFYKQKKH